MEDSNENVVKKEQPLVPVVSKRPSKILVKADEHPSLMMPPSTNSWPHFGLLAAAALAQQRKNSEQQTQWSNLMTLKSPSSAISPNPILALIANRSSQLFGFFRSANHAILDLPTILMLQNNILSMIHTQNKQVRFDQ